MASILAENVVIGDANVRGFEYVVEKPKPARVCFGSGLRRDTCTIGRHLTGFQKMFTTEENRLSPFAYDTAKYKTLSQQPAQFPMGIILPTGERIRYVTGPRAARFNDVVVRTPSPTRYDVSFKWGNVKQSKCAFDQSGSYDRKKMPETLAPGPGTYSAETRRCRTPASQDNFGRKTFDDVIEMICVSRPCDYCTKCTTLCEGDYWHIEYATFLCMLCWLEEKRTREIYAPKELARFKKIRNCSFMHNHEGTTAAVTLLPKEKLRKKYQIERYLNSFIKY